MYEEQIKDHAHHVGMSVCGIASVDRFKEAPAGHHPCDILPGCKSVIMIGMRLLDGAIQANFRAFEDGRWDLKGLYGTYGYSTLPNFALTYACYSIAQFIEQKTGACATPLSTGPMTNGIQISLRHAAVAAGLGEFGWSGLVLVPGFGPRIRFGAVLTTLDLEPDPVYSGPSLCNPDKCGICTNVCPTQALSTYENNDRNIVDLGEKHCEYCRTTLPKCQIALYALNKKNGGDEDYVTESEPSAEEIISALKKKPISHIGLQHYPSYHCGRCLSYCPAGDWGKRFKETGLSKGANSGKK